MTLITPRPARIFFGTALGLAALCAASAIAASEPPAGSSVTGQPSGKRMHKPYAATTENSVACTSTDAQPVKVASDPEEGGQVTDARTKSAPAVSDLTVTKSTDTASPKLMDKAAPATTCPAH